MIDSIKIRLKRFSGNFDNCVKVIPRNLIKDIDETDLVYNNYRLYNTRNLEKHYLRVSLNKRNGYVTVSGSIRKWYFNRVSLLDISKCNFIKALKEIADLLNISYAEMINATFTNCEVGANIRTRIDALSILPMIVSYSQYDRIDKYIEKGTLYFRGSDRLLKLYVKDDEIAAHSFAEVKRVNKKKSFDILKSKGIHYLRIEFTLKNHRSFRNLNLDFIRTLSDLVENYSELYNLWTKELSRMIVYGSLKYDEEALSARERDIIFGLENYGFFEFVDAYQNICTSNTLTTNSAKTAKSKAFKSICNVLDKYYDPKVYNKFNLRVDAAKYLIGKSKQFNLNLPVLIRNLWGI